MRATAVRPDGLVYEPDLLDASEEARLLDVLRRLELRPVEMRGQASRRTVRMFGFDYDFSSFGLTPTDPLPASLAVLRGRVFELELAPRSAYVLAGQARSAWQHSIPPVREERWSVTFRTLRNPERWRA